MEEMTFTLRIRNSGTVPSPEYVARELTNSLCDTGWPEQAFSVLPVANNEFYVVGEDDQEATLLVNVTEEGIILDLIVDGQVVMTWGRTAQEIVDSFEFMPTGS
jgi:hypothetical protein